MTQKYSNYQLLTNKKHIYIKKLMIASLVIVSLVYLFFVSIFPITFLSRLMILGVIFMIYAFLFLFLFRFLAEFKIRNNVAVIQVSNKKMILPISKIRNKSHFKFIGFNFAKVCFTLDGKKHNYFYVKDINKTSHPKSRLRVA